MILDLENLLQEIKAEPYQRCLTTTELRYMNELEYLRTKDMTQYLKYYIRYECVKRKKLKDRGNP